MQRRHCASRGASPRSSAEVERRLSCPMRMRPQPQQAHGAKRPCPGHGNGDVAAPEVSTLGNDGAVLRVAPPMPRSATQE
eukprot:8778599-Alexandrium_andersonii.AAC.1